MTSKRFIRCGPLSGVAALLLSLGILAPRASFGAEGALSHYLPGTAGDIAVASSPEPGFQIAATAWVQSGDIGAAVLQGAVNVDLGVDIALALPSASYTWDLPSIGATYTVAAAIPFGYAKLGAGVVGPGGNQINFREESFHLSDISVVPFQLNWQIGNFSFKFAEAIVAPTGGYNVNNRVNLGRNYWSFSTVGAVTWLNPDTGTEASIAPGIMINTTNNDTDYRTGSEFFVDFTANQFLSPSFALGLRGYYYRQVGGDSGSGALLGDFKSEALGLGPGFLWTPEFAEGRLTVLGKWMRDVRARNRFKSDYVTLTLAWKF
ncbi:MAG: transporter [Pseudomonadota bacterium]